MPNIHENTPKILRVNETSNEIIHYAKFVGKFQME
jgi:hypothetical protein